MPEETLISLDTNTYKRPLPLIGRQLQGLQEERSQVSVDSWRKRAPTPTRSVGRAGDRPREEVTPTRRGGHSVQPGSSVPQREGAPTLRAGHRAMRHAEFVQAGMGKG